MKKAVLARNLTNKMLFITAIFLSVASGFIGTVVAECFVYRCIVVPYVYSLPTIEENYAEDEDDD
jgi:hypothetical protein